VSWLPTDLTASSVASGSWAAVRAGDRDIVVTRIADVVYAVEDRCSHAGCPFSEDSEIDGPIVVCDCHGSEFDIRSGVVVRPPASRPIATFPARVTDGIIEVDL
jgi:nitrite reductase/ring-hydroxylating ferredoxin subunit